jgi:aspartyl-tRNA(Asn)/glutamyl-tRNA(Gln) amidotransferase subunit C
MSISHEEVLRIAALARIAVRPEEAAALLERLNRVLALVEQMRRADTTGVEPMAHPLDAVQRLRADEVTERDQRDLYQSVAPDRREGLYLVPKVLE